MRWRAVPQNGQGQGGTAARFFSRIGMIEPLPCTHANIQHIEIGDLNVEVGTCDCLCYVARMLHTESTLDTAGAPNLYLALLEHRIYPTYSKKRVVLLSFAAL